MGFEARLSARADGSNVDVTARSRQGEELLTGRKGEVRQALQHLLKPHHQPWRGDALHLQLEINDFWQRREAELETMARTMADEAVAKRREVLTEYLISNAPQDRSDARSSHVTSRVRRGDSLSGC